MVNEKIDLKEVIFIGELDLKVTNLCESKKFDLGANLGVEELKDFITKMRGYYLVELKSSMTLNKLTRILEIINEKNI